MAQAEEGKEYDSAIGQWWLAFIVKKRGKR
jgi:hypothetical protein